MIFLHDLQQKLVHGVAEPKSPFMGSVYIQEEAQIKGLVQDAYEHRASDIHLDSTALGLRVRYRIDGHLYDRHRLDLGLAKKFFSKLKISSGIETGRSYHVGEGHMRLTTTKDAIDIRVSILPSLHGQTAVLRLVHRDCVSLQLGALGLSTFMQARLEDILKQPSGLFLGAGPTGAGKTTTLYAALNFLKAQDRKILTIENPVEQVLSGIQQIDLGHSRSMSMAQALKATLRQAPNVVLIGEMRDAQTAQLAVHAALTGHLVLSSLHAYDAEQVFWRLRHWGIELSAIQQSLKGILTQRLEAKPCNDCDYLASVNCPTCLGYRTIGRTGYFDLFDPQLDGPSILHEAGLNPT